MLTPDSEPDSPSPTLSPASPTEIQPASPDFPIELDSGTVNTDPQLPPPAAPQSPRPPQES